MYDRKDHYWKRAKEEGYRSRAAYKLLEIQKRHRILRRNDRVLDLGAAPGGWVQVIAGEVGTGGRVFAVDRVRIPPLPFEWVEFLQGDLLDLDFCQRLQDVLGCGIRVVTSDMAPDTTGIRFQDHVRSCELVRRALAVSRSVLAPGGTFLAKIFQGGDTRAVMEEARKDFRAARWIVPASTRKESSEMYLLSTGFQPDSRQSVARGKAML